MNNKTARIRPLLASDKAHVTFIIGKANFESLAVANHQVYSHPLALVVWVLLSSIFIQAVNWWPSSHRSFLGILGYLKPLPAFAATAVPLMFLVDWKNRPHFESRTQEAIKERDLRHPTDYYSQSPASGFWILEYGEQFIGLIALDANEAGRTQGAFIRHFYVEEAYRKTGIQDDLLNHAVKHAFDKNSKLELIKAVDAPTLAAYIHNSYQKAGFRLSEEYQAVGILGRWRFYTTSLRKRDYKAIN